MSSLSPSVHPALLGLFVLALGLLLFALRRPSLGVGAGGKTLLFVAFFLLPLLLTFLGTASHLERSKSTEFCLSCHVMEPYGESLMIDSGDHLAATHFQNHRVPQEQACFTCHTTYTMYGDLQAKLRGLRHLYVNYLGEIPETLALYEPYANRECLSCHGGARSFEEDELHAELRAELQADEISCLECHAPVHDVENLRDYEPWEAPVAEQARQSRGPRDSERVTQAGGGGR